MISVAKADDALTRPLISSILCKVLDQVKTL